MKNLLLILVFSGMIFIVIYGIVKKKFVDRSAIEVVDNYLNHIQSKNYVAASVLRNIDHKTLAQNWTQKIEKLGALVKWNIYQSIAHSEIGGRNFTRVTVRIYLENQQSFYLVVYNVGEVDGVKTIQQSYLDNLDIQLDEIW